MKHVHNANIQVIRYTSIVLAALYPATIPLALPHRAATTITLAHPTHRCSSPDYYVSENYWNLLDNRFQ